LGFVNAVKVVCVHANTSGVMHLAEECCTYNSRSATHEVCNFNEVQQDSFWYGEEESDLVIVGLEKKSREKLS